MKNEGERLSLTTEEASVKEGATQAGSESQLATRHGHVRARHLEMNRVNSAVCPS